MTWWNDLFYTRAQSWIYAALEPTAVPGQTDRVRVSANEAYARIYLKSLRIVNVRKGLETFYGAVHSYASFLHTSGQPAQFSKLIVPNQLKNVDANRIDRVININQSIAGWTPYRGDDVEVEVGLFSVKAVDLADSFLNLLEQIVQQTKAK